MMRPRVTSRFLTWRQPLGNPDCPYTYRWALNFGRLGSLRVHRWLRSDEAVPHDHPAGFWTFVLRGSYMDLSYRPCGLLCCTGQHCVWCWRMEEMTPGMLRYRPPEHVHRVSLRSGECWTVLWFRPEVRLWGYFVNGTWVRAKDYFERHGFHPCDPL